MGYLTRTKHLNIALDRLDSLGQKLSEGDECLTKGRDTYKLRQDLQRWSAVGLAQGRSL